jgi:tripartite-type tricarboxylate transporter receptor subunit TctC
MRLHWGVRVVGDRTVRASRFPMRGLLAGVAIGLAASVATAATAAEVNFAGKSVELIITSDAGGGTDLMGRLVGRYMGKYLPGHPVIVAKNMGSGAGKVLAANYVTAAKPDGLTLMQSDSDTLQESMLRLSAVRYDPAKFRVVGAISRGGSIAFIRKDAVARLHDPKAAPVIVGDTDGQRSWEAMMVWGKEFLGWNLRWVKGYEGTGPLTMALRKAEVDVFATDGLNAIEPLRKDGLIDFLVQQGQIDGTGYTPRRVFLDVPIFPVLLQKAGIPDLAYHGYRSVIAPSDIDKWIALPPNTPADILGAYRTAFESMVVDPEFAQNLAKQISEETYVAHGADVERAIGEVRNASPEVTKYAHDLRVKYNLVQN